MQKKFDYWLLIALVINLLMTTYTVHKIIKNKWLDAHIPMWKKYIRIWYVSVQDIDLFFTEVVVVIMNKDFVTFNQVDCRFILKARFPNTRRGCVAAVVTLLRVELSWFYLAIIDIQLEKTQMSARTPGHWRNRKVVESMPLSS